MPNLTPPPMSEDLIDELSRVMVKGGKSVNWLSRAIIAARDEQWRQRLEIVGWHYRTNGAWDHFHAGTEPPPEDAYDAGSLVPLYRIKEQG